MADLYNLLKDSFSISNTNLCRYDSIHGFKSDFSKNGNVDGWDVYSNVCIYGAWNDVLFGTSLDRTCYISRSNNIIAIPAEKYYLFKLTMKLTIPEKYEDYAPTTGKLMWQTTSDPTWDEDKSLLFELDTTDQWYTYVINAAEAQYWIGDISNFRVFPFIDGKPDIRFTIKSIVVDSINDFKCLNTQCSYHSKFSHPCSGIGTPSSITSGVPKEKFTLVSGVNDDLIVNMDGYGDEKLRLGEFTNLSGKDMAKILVDKISRVGIGQYTYVDVKFDETKGLITIFSGSTVSTGAYITISGNAAEVLGFVDEYGNDVSKYTYSIEPATGFDYAASRRLKGFEINRLIDSDTEIVAYYHNPNQYVVEAGRADYADSMSDSRGSRSVELAKYDEIDGNNKLIIDATHPVNDSGRITYIAVNGTKCGDVPGASPSSTLGNWWTGGIESDFGTVSTGFKSKIVLIRPYKNGDAEIIKEVVLEDQIPGLVYTVDHITYSVEVDWQVNRGDLIGFYNFNIMCPFSHRNNTPNAVYFTKSDLPEGRFSLGKPSAYGVVGLAYHARSTRLQENIKLDIDLGQRRNLEEISVFGQEDLTFFEYNVAACLDVDWYVDLHGENHKHDVGHCFHGAGFTAVHANVAYGVEALSDCIRTPDGGKQGDGFQSWPDGGEHGLVTAGTHIYFYVNGDAEWLNGGCYAPSDSDHNYWHQEFRSPWHAGRPYNYEFDPISFRLLFPNNRKLPIHKSSIYFKESNNFKHLSLSYYMGPQGPGGDAEELNYQYVPSSSFRSVTIDGDVYTPTSFESSNISKRFEKIYFSNPWPWAKPEYVDNVCTNWDIYQTMMNERVNVIINEFDPVECYGFKIHNAWHKSTKISEMEVFSSVPIEPSLLDNVYIQYSIYGEDWLDLIFKADELDEERINAYVPGSPRYLRMEIQSQDLFKLKEVSAKVTEEHIKSLDCSDIVLVDNAPRGELIDLPPFYLENTYGIPLDLYVDIPNRLFKINDILSWIRFDSEETTTNAEVGPGAVIRKNNDYDIVLSHGQVANNCLCYYLNNLIDNKKSYVLENEGSWSFYKTLENDVDVGYINDPNGVANIIDLPTVSSRFWKISSYEAVSYELNNITLYRDISDNVQNTIWPDKVYIQAQTGVGSGKIETTLNTEFNTINPAVLIEDDFSDGEWVDKWNYDLGNNINNNFVEGTNKLIPYIMPGDSIYIEKSFGAGTVSFDFELEFNLDLPNELVYNVEFFNTENEVVLRLRLSGQSSSILKIVIESPIPLDQEIYSNIDDSYYRFYDINLNKSVDQYNDGFKFLINKSYNVINTLKLQNSNGDVIYHESNDLQGAFFDRVSKLRITYTNLSSNSIQSGVLDFSTKYVRFRALPFLSDKESIVFSFDGAEAIDTIKIIQSTGDLAYPAVLLSYNDQNDYFFLARNFELSGNLAAYTRKAYCNWEANEGHDCFRSANYTNSTGSRDYFWVVYDFGAGNKTRINKVWLTRYRNYSYANGFKYINVYGVNTYNVNYTKSGGYISNPMIDLSGATFLTRLDVSYTTGVSEIEFTNYEEYRYIILHWPETDDGETSRIHIAQIKFYRTFDNPTDKQLVLNNREYTNYFAIDFGKVHSLEFLRNYGDVTTRLDLLNITDSALVEFSSTDTDNPSDVNWREDEPSLLLNFNDYTDSSEFNHTVNVIGDTTLLSTESPVTPNGHISFEGGYLEIPSLGNFELDNLDFVIDFWANRRSYNMYGNENYWEDDDINTGGVQEIFIWPSTNIVISLNKWYGVDFTENREVRKIDLHFYGCTEITVEFYDEYPFNSPVETFFYSGIWTPHHYVYEEFDSPIQCRYLRVMYSNRYRNYTPRVYKGGFDAIAPYEGVLGRVKDKNINSSFSFNFDMSDKITATIYNGPGVVELQSMDELLGEVWYHIALTRYQDTLALYIDGVMHSSYVLDDNKYLNITDAPMIIGSVDGYPYKGYMDELRFIVGTSFWISNFTPKSIEYTSDDTDDINKVRWMRVPMACGDGTLRRLHYLEVYPNTMFPYLLDGGFNCEWTAIGNDLTSYNKVVENMAPRSVIWPTNSFTYTFESLPQEWTNLTKVETTYSGFNSTDFTGDNSENFWFNTDNNLVHENSYIEYDNALKIHLDEEEGGHCLFRTDNIYGECSFEIDFVHDLNYIGPGEIKSRLTIHKYDGSKNFTIERLMSSNSASVRVYSGNTLNNNLNFTAPPDAIEKVTRFKILREDINITLYYYNNSTSSWITVRSYEDVDFEIVNNEVYFTFEVNKNGSFPEENVNINYVIIDQFNYNISSDVVWGIEEYEENRYCLKSLTPWIPTDYGPKLELDVLVGGKEISYFRFYYFDQGDGGGFSFVDSNGDEILGVASFAPKCGIKGINGWNILDNFPFSGLNCWYTVEITFDWENGQATITWRDESVLGSSITVVDLINNTDVEFIQIRSVFAWDWGTDLLSTKFTNINLLVGKNWMQDWTQNNCVSGDSSQQGYENCWGFSSTDEKPTLLLEFDEITNIDKFVLYHSPTETIEDWLNTEYTISVSTSRSGIFTPVVEEVGNTNYISTHELETSVACSFVKLEIHNYTKPSPPRFIYTEAQDGGMESLIEIDGGFLREFEVWSSNYSSQFSAKDYYKICIDLKDNFFLNGSELDIYKSYYNNPLDVWQNTPESFQFSDALTSDPRKVAYNDSTGGNIPFFYGEELIDRDYGGGPFIIGIEVFLPKGRYEVTWKTYNTLYEEYVAIDIIGSSYIETFYSINTSDGWSDQINSVSLSEGGYCTIQVRVTVEEGIDVWGVSNITFKNIQETARWISVKRTYLVSEPNAHLKRFEDNCYLRKIKIFSSTEQMITNKHWWWSSNASTLSNEYVNVKDSNSALKINFPNSDKLDVIRFLEADSFGIDDLFSIKDYLSFWFFISDISLLDIEEAGFAFGSFDGYSEYYLAPDVYGKLKKRSRTKTESFFVWEMSKLDLKSGWNYVRLKFEDYDDIWPEPDSNTKALSEDLNFRYELSSSFGMVIKGKGTNFYMLLDGIKIERNRFDDEVMFGDKGLCLTWQEYAEIPIASAEIKRGSIEMWLKLYTDTYGIDHFGITKSRTLFTLINSDNDVISLSIRGSDWFEIGFGNAKSGYYILYVDAKLVDLTNYAFNIGDTVHLAMAWDNEGKQMGNSHTMRFYVNGDLTMVSTKVWDVWDSKGAVLRLGGGNTYLANNDDADGSAIFSNVKYYSYCKTSFEINEQIPSVLNKKSPNDFIQISKDGMNYYGVSSLELPFFFQELEPNEKVKIYTRIDKTMMKQLDQFTGSLSVDWKLPV